MSPSPSSSQIVVLRESFRSGKTKTYQWRVKQLKSLRQMVEKHQNEFVTALNKDLGRSYFESIGFDLLGVIWEIDHVLKHLHVWMQPVHTAVPLTMYPATAEYVYEPYGVCLIIGAFNFPIVLTLSPLIGAIMSGNCAIIKPSEVSVNCEKLLADLLPQYLDTSCFKVVCGGVDTTSDLLKQRFDKIFFTGSVRVGKVVMRAAAEYLTPVSLELGGKSPTIVDESVTDMALVARRIVWGKLVNAGQICIAPDYIYCHEKIYDKFLNVMKQTIIQFHGENPQISSAYARIVSVAHTQRLANLLKPYENNNKSQNYKTALLSSPPVEGEIYHGGEVDIDNRYIAPTLLTGITFDHPIMQEEIFGPILPIFKYSNINEVINTITSGGSSKTSGSSGNNNDCSGHLENPLVMYIFSKNRKVIDLLIQKIPSGGVVVNDVLFHFANEFLPFGGRGNSGMGSYKGKFSFEAFSHRRAILRRDDHGIFDIPVRYPPYKDYGLSIFKLAGQLPAIPSVTLGTFLFRTTVLSAAVLMGAFVGAYWNKK